MKYTLHFTYTAECDLRDIAFSVARISGSKDTAKQFVTSLRACTERLKDFPFSGARPRDRVMLSGDFRYLVHGDYLIFYTVDEINRMVKIFAIFNAKQDYARVLKKYI